MSHEVKARSTATKACTQCGGSLADRGRTAIYCETCAALRNEASTTARTERVKASDGLGVFRAGPVVFDWDGVVSVARCEECVDWSRFKIGGKLGVAARMHANRAHGFKGKTAALADQHEDRAA